MTENHERNQAARLSETAKTAEEAAATDRTTLPALPGQNVAPQSVLPGNQENAVTREAERHARRRRRRYAQDWADPASERMGSPAGDAGEPAVEGSRRHGRRNFWSGWHEQRRMRHQGMEFKGENDTPLEERQAWREYFHGQFGTLPEQHWIFGGRRFSPWHQGVAVFNPFVASLLSRGGGLLPLIILNLVSQQPRYGNELMDLLADLTRGQWVSNPGAIYPLLSDLENLGFIEGKWEDPDKRTMRMYTITPAGEAEVERIGTIVLPKLTETRDILAELIAALQSPAGDQV